MATLPFMPSHGARRKHTGNPRQSERGRPNRVSAQPDPRLRPLLCRDYLGFRHEGPGGQRWIEPAKASVTLMVDLEEPLRAGGKKLPEAWLGGPSGAPDLVELSEHHTSLDLKLTPLGAYTLLSTPPRQLAGAIVSLDDFFGPAGRDLAGRLRDASSWERRFALLEAFLLKRAETGPQPNPAVARAWSRLHSTAGKVSIGDLAVELQMSRRHLTATFHEQVGLPPKTVARLLRFERVRKRLPESPVRWAEVAQECGYCDQSHLNRDFHDFAGTTPGDFLGLQPISGEAGGGDLPFVQDGSDAVP